jgi:hypothetical protein
MADLLDFTPAPTRKQHAGWTAERQRGFVAALLDGLSPGEAAVRVGLARQSGYRLRARAGAEAFAAAWDRAQEASRRLRALEPAGDHAVALLDGLLVPHFRRGRFVGFSIRHDEAGVIRALGAHYGRQRRQG